MPRRPRSPRLTRLALTGVVVIALGASACGGTTDVSKEKFSADLQKRTTVDGTVIVRDAVATCLTDKIFAEYDQSEVNRIYRAATQTELDDDVRAKLTTFNKDCFEAEGPPVSEDDGATTTVADGDATTTTAEG